MGLCQGRCPALVVTDFLVEVNRQFGKAIIMVTSYLDQLRKRMSELENQLKQLDDDFRNGKLSGSDKSGPKCRTSFREKGHGITFRRVRTRPVGWSR